MVFSVLSYNMLRAIKLKAVCLKAKEVPVKPEPPIVSTQPVPPGLFVQPCARGR